MYFLKRSQSQDANKNDIPAYSETKKLKEQNSILNETKRQHEATASTISNNSIQEIIESNYKNFPATSGYGCEVSTERGCFEKFRKELYDRDYPNVITRHMGLINRMNLYVLV